MKILDIIDPERVKAELRVVNASHPELTVAEKQRLLLARNGIIYLPSYGKHGRIMPQVADKIGVSRQYVHSTLFPDDPSRLFGTGLSSMLVWTETANLVFSNPLYPQLKEVFETLLEKRELVVKVRRPMLEFITKRAAELGVKVNAVNKSGKNFATYWLREEPHDD